MGADSEREQILHAMDRLLTGTPLRSSGNLTIVALAEEADVKRHLLTHRHKDLKDTFYARVALQSGMLPIEQALRAEISELKERLLSLKAENKVLSDNAVRFARVIRLLTSENDVLQKKGSNVVSMASRRVAKAEDASP